MRPPLLGVARHSETHEPLVVYRPLHNATGWWVRPHAMFFEVVVVESERSHCAGSRTSLGLEAVACAFGRRLRAQAHGGQGGCFGGGSHSHTKQLRKNKLSGAGYYLAKEMLAVKASDTSNSKLDGTGKAPHVKQAMKMVIVPDSIRSAFSSRSRRTRLPATGPPDGCKLRFRSMK